LQVLPDDIELTSPELHTISRYILVCATLMVAGYCVMTRADRAIGYIATANDEVVKAIDQLAVTNEHLGHSTCAGKGRQRQEDHDPSPTGSLACSALRWIRHGDLTLGKTGARHSVSAARPSANLQ
jgi:hypothetical protein